MLVYFTLFIELLLIIACGRNMPILHVSHCKIHFYNENNINIHMYGERC